MLYGVAVSAKEPIRIVYVPAGSDGSVRFWVPAVSTVRTKMPAALLMLNSGSFELDQFRFTNRFVVPVTVTRYRSTSAALAAEPVNVMSRTGERAHGLAP